VKVNGRRLQRHGGLFAHGKLITVPLPAWLEQLSRHIHAVLGPEFFPKAPSHVLVNKYEAGEGIMAHADGPCYQPIVAILSLGSPAIFRFFQQPAAINTDPIPSARQIPESPQTSSTPDRIQNPAICQHGTRSSQGPEISVIVPPRSLLVFRGDMYDKFMHGIDAAEEEVIDGSVVNSGLCTCVVPAMAIGVDPKTGITEPIRFPVKPLNYGGRDHSMRKQQDSVIDCTCCAVCGTTSFRRTGPRVSLTLRNAARECKLMPQRRP
jgi:hypothetical protein